ncbi:MAG: FHA domain-containing protein [Deltaproteobacteria bacterium]|nr:FHA domain-containing protein [Deltaproteobacteria bacterium]
MILVKVHEADHIETHKVEIFPCVIGRSMHCGIRIDDPSVSARHAEIHQSAEGYVLKDLFSTNGIWQAGGKVKEVRLGARESFVFGDVQIEFLTQDTLERTHDSKVLPHEHSETPYWLSVKIVAALFLALLIGFTVPALEQYLWYWPPEKFGELIGRSILLWLQLSAVALAISIFCKVNLKRFNFHKVLILICLSFVAERVISNFMPSIIFNLHNLTGAKFLKHLAYGVVIYILLVRLQRYALPKWQLRYRRWVAVGVSGISMLIIELVIERQLGERSRMADLGMPITTLGPSQGSDDLMFAIGLTIAATDQERIRQLERLESGDD